MLGENVSILIVHRNAHADRLENLNTILDYYHSILPNLEIILVEEDTTPKLKNLPSWVKHIFVYNPGVFNSAWGYNIAARASTRPICVAICNDTIIKYSNFMIAQREVERFHWGCYIPYLFFYHMDICQTKKFREDFKIPDDRCIAKKLSNQPGGIVFFDKQVFFDIGGYNEDFQGWAPEDAEFAIKNEKVGLMKKDGSPEHSIYHLFHFRFETTHGKDTKENREGEVLFSTIKRYSVEQMKQHIRILKSRDIGNSSKYQNLKNR